MPKSINDFTFELSFNSHWEARRKHNYCQNVKKPKGENGL